MKARPLEILNLAAVLLLSAVALGCAAAGRLPGWPRDVVRDALLAAALLAVALLVRRDGDIPARWFLDFYPMAFIPIVYESLGTLIPAVRGPSHDEWLVAADRAVFGVDPTVWLERFVWPPLTDLLLLAYSTYYFFPIIVGVLLWRRDRGLARRFIFGLSLAFYLSYAGYFLVPAKGPRVALASRQTVALEVTPVSRQITRTLNELEHTKNDAFPSGHTMITVYCLLVAFRQVRPLFRAWLPVAILLVVSTVYCRFHYVVDVAAGIVLAFLALPLGGWAYRKLETAFS